MGKLVLIFTDLIYTLVNFLKLINHKKQEMHVLLIFSELTSTEQQIFTCMRYCTFWLVCTQTQNSSSVAIKEIVHRDKLKQIIILQAFNMLNKINNKVRYFSKHTLDLCCSTIVFLLKENSCTEWRHYEMKHNDAMRRQDLSMFYNVIVFVFC